MKFVIDKLPAPIKRLYERANNSPVGRRLLYGFSWSMTGAFSAKIFAVVSSVVVARTLGSEIYGEFGIIQSTVGTFQVFAGFSLGLTANKHVAQYRNSDPKRAGEIIGMSGMVAMVTGGLVASIFVFAAPWLAANTIAAPHLANLLRIGGILLFFGALNGAQGGALSGFEAFRAQTLLTMFNGFLSPIILVAGVFLGELNGVILALVFVTICNCSATHLVLRRVMANNGVPYRFKVSLNNLKVLRDFSLPAVMAGLMAAPVNWVCNALLVNQPGGYAQMGIYNATLQWFNAVMFFPRVLSGVVIPVLSERFEARDNVSMKKVLSASIKANGTVAFVIITAGVLCSPFIMGLYGAGYEEGWPTLIFVLLAALFAAIQTPVSQLLLSSGSVWAYYCLNMVWALFFIAITYNLVEWGSYGLALSRFSAYLIHALITIVYAKILVKKYYI